MRVTRSGRHSQKIAVASAICMAFAPALGGEQDRWAFGGKDLSDLRFQRASAINPTNAPALKLKWAFTTRGDVSTTPAVDDGAVYFPDFGGGVYSVDAATGTARWTSNVADITGIPGNFSRTSAALTRNKVIFGDQGGSFAKWNGQQLTGPGARVFALDRNTGDPLWVSQVETFSAAVITSSPVAHDGVIYVGVSSVEEVFAASPSYPCCTFRGSVVALDERDGHVLWKSYMVPENKLPGRGYSGAAVWSSTPVVDLRRNSIYVGTGNNYSVPTDVAECQKVFQSRTYCTDAVDFVDAVVALDRFTGSVKWANRGMSYDAWNAACSRVPAGVANCPSPEGPDYDFGSGANLISIPRDDASTFQREILGIGEKSGIYWGLNPADGGVVWKTQVGPGSRLGGIMWGTASDGRQVYVSLANFFGAPYALQPSGAQANGGSWTAIDVVTGSINWQTATPGPCAGITSSQPQGCAALGPSSVTNGVVFVGSMDTNPAKPTMFALDAATGTVIWSYATGSSVASSPAIVGDSIYWGAGYKRFGSGNNKLFAFALPARVE